MRLQFLAMYFHIEPKCESHSYFRSFVNHQYRNRYIKIKNIYIKKY